MFGLFKGNRYHDCFGAVNGLSAFRFRSTASGRSKPTNLLAEVNSELDKNCGTVKIVGQSILVPSYSFTALISECVAASSIEATILSIQASEYV